VKTDSRDAQQLVRLLHLGEIVGVTIPSVEQEAARDLVRAREDCRCDLMSTRQRISKLLLRQGIVYCSGEAWTVTHEHWLRKQHFEIPGLQMAADSQFTAVADRLQCVRGISTLTSFALAVEIGDWQRFTGRSIGAYLGLVPSEYSSGSSRVQGGLTKTGNGHVRRLLIEAAWHHRKPYRPGRRLRQRWETASPAARARGHAANRRLNARWVRFDQRHKRPAIANAAVARELAGWCWSLAVLDD
jgi:transposase